MSPERESHGLGHQWLRETYFHLEMLSDRDVHADVAQFPSRGIVEHDALMQQLSGSETYAGVCGDTKRAPADRG
jgi:hypothetical protein